MSLFLNSTENTFLTFVLQRQSLGLFASFSCAAANDNEFLSKQMIMIAIKDMNSKLRPKR